LEEALDMPFDRLLIVTDDDEDGLEMRPDLHPYLRKWGNELNHWRNVCLFSGLYQ